MKLQLIMDFGDDPAEFAEIAPKLAAIFAGLKSAASAIGKSAVEAAATFLPAAEPDQDTPTEATEPKRGRGRPRKTEATEAAPAVQEAAPAPVAPSAPAAPETPASAATEPTAAPSGDFPAAPKNYDEFRKPMMDLFQVLGAPAATKLMKDNGGYASVSAIAADREGETGAEAAARIAAFWPVLCKAIADAKAAKAAAKAK